MDRGWADPTTDEGPSCWGGGGMHSTTKRALEHGLCRVQTHGTGERTPGCVARYRAVQLPDFVLFVLCCFQCFYGKMTGTLAFIWNEKCYCTGEDCTWAAPPVGLWLFGEPRLDLHAVHAEALHAIRLYGQTVRGTGPAELCGGTGRNFCVAVDHAVAKWGLHCVVEMCLCEAVARTQTQTQT